MNVLVELESAWRRSDRILQLVQPDGWHRRPLPLRHPPVFYLGHLPAFAWNQVGRGLLGLGDHDAALDDLFERGIDPLSDTDADAESISTWPELTEILAYRDAVRDRVRALAPRTTGGDEPLGQQGRILHVVLEHELMHHETLLYLLQEEPVAHLDRPAGWPNLRTGAARAESRPVRIPAGTVRLGTTLGEVPFAWDNELSAQQVAVEAFTLDSLPVDLDHFARFVTDGGYAHRELWSDAAWQWLAGRTHPHGWRRRATGFEVRSMLQWHPLAQVSGWPAQVSQVEARAYARWSSGQLPTEAQLHHAAYGSPDGGERARPWGEGPLTIERANVDFATGGPVPVGSAPAGASAFGVQELLGNGWEWTRTPFRPLPGFTPWIRTYPGYSADFFDDAHTVVFGGSWATAAALTRRSFRNWYQRHYPYVFSSFRLVRPA